MFLTEKSNQAFLPEVREHGSFLYAICSHYLQFHINCNIRHADEQNTSQRCLQMMFMTRSNI